LEWEKEEQQEGVRKPHNRELSDGILEMIVLPFGSYTPSIFTAIYTPSEFIRENINASEVA
jgi:hypothetical protein